MRFRVSNLMDEIWERAVESALDGQTNESSVQTLTLDGAVKCVHGRLPPPPILEKFHNLHHLSIANIGVSSLEQFPVLRNLQKLILSDNRIACGLNYLVEAGLESLRDLDLSNNRIQFIEDLAPLAELRLLSLDLYECPVTRVKDYRARVFGLIKSLRYLDKMDAEDNERPESDEEDDEDEDDEEEDDPGSGEVDGDERAIGMNNGHNLENDGVVDVYEDEESDADEEESEIVRNGVVRESNQQSNGFHVVDLNEDEDDEDGEYEEDNDSGEEINEEDGEEEDVVEVHEIEDSDDEEDDGIEEDEDDGGDEEEEEEEVDNEEANLVERGSNGRLTSTEGEIDGHEHGEDDEEEGEGYEEEEGVEEERDFDDEEEEEDGARYSVQPVGHAVEDATGSDMDPLNDEDDDLDEEEVEDDNDLHGRVESSTSHLKRKRDNDADLDEDDDDEDDDNDDDDGDGDEGEDDAVEYPNSSKRR